MRICASGTTKSPSNWSPLPVQGALCIEQLSAQDVHIETGTTSAEHETEPVTLPELTLPLSLKLKQLTLAGCICRAQELLRNLQLSAHSTGNQLMVDTLTVEQDDLRLALDGQLSLSKAGLRQSQCPCATQLSGAANLAGTASRSRRAGAPAESASEQCRLS